MAIADPGLTLRLPARISRLCEDLRAHQLEAQWRIESHAMPLEPAPRAWTWRWEWAALAGLAARAAELVDVAPGGSHRVLGCANPGLRRAYGGSVYGATQSLWAGVECLRAGESSRAHRHSVSAVRLGVSGAQVWTTVNGERCLLAPGDVVITPGWAWHDHHNDGDELALWLNLMDFPLASYAGARFFELHPFVEHQPVVDTHAGLRAFPAAGLVPQRLPAIMQASRSGAPDGVVNGPRTEVLRYPWPRTREALEALRGDGRDACDGVLVHLVDPLTGGPVTPTMGAAAQLLEAGTATLAHRHVHSVVYQVVEGAGFSVVDGVRIDWSARDVLALPPWAVHEHHAPHGDVVLLSVTDQPAVLALGLERVAELGERQRVHASFTGRGCDGTL